MFAIEQIIAAHSQVKTGADFPVYIKELKKLGVVRYEAFVSDGHTMYFGENGFSVSSKEKYMEMVISDACDSEGFKADLKAHQTGKTDYYTFCCDCAKSGIDKWEVLLNDNTCTYFDKLHIEILEEKIPG